MPVATFARASVAYKQDGSSVVSGAPRYETGKYGQAITIEEATTNHALWSDDFSNVVWEKYRATITPNAIAAPDGTMTADKLVEDTTTNTHLIAQPNVFVLTTQPAATSIIAKAGERSWIATVFGSATPTYFNLATGVVGSVGPGVTASITPVGNGWYLCKASIATAAYSHEAVWELATGDGGDTYLGNGASGVYIWRAHAERKAYPTTPVKTEGATAARAAESLTIPTSGVLNASQGTIEGWWYHGSPHTAYLWDTEATAGRFRAVRLSGGTIDLYLNNALVTNFNAGAAGWRHYAVTWNGTAVRVYLDGAQVATATLGTAVAFTGVNTLYLGSNNASGEQWGERIDDLRVSNVARTAQEIAAVATSPRAASVD